MVTIDLSVQPTLLVDVRIRGPVGHRIERVPAALESDLRPATLILHEWVDYIVEVPGATGLQVGSRRLATIAPGITSLFALTFTNQLGLSAITAYRDEGIVSTTLWVEVIAPKMGMAAQSVAFMRALLDDLFAEASPLPYAISSETQRWVQETHRPPSDLFVYHFFRHRELEVRRAVQAIIGHPHRRLGEVEERVRPHEVRHLAIDDLTRLLQSGRVGRDSGGLTFAQRLRTDRIHQRLPIETYDTAENRFIVAATRAMLEAIERLTRRPWFMTRSVAMADRRRIEAIAGHLRLLLRDPRFSALPPSVRVPAQSRVLQRKDGYREATLLWQRFARARSPVFEHLQSAIDLRNVATMYEIWVLFEIAHRIEAVTGVKPMVTGDGSAPGSTWKAMFPAVGELCYQPSFSTYSGITLRPDVVWRPISGRTVALDAKFRLTSLGEVFVEGEKVQDATSKDADIGKMHVYRDAIDEVAASIVVFPGTQSRFRSIDGEDVALTWDRIVAGDLDGVGAIAARPIAGGGMA